MSFNSINSDPEKLLNLGPNSKHENQVNQKTGSSDSHPNNKNDQRIAHLSLPAPFSNRNNDIEDQRSRKTKRVDSNIHTSGGQLADSVKSDGVQKSSKSVKRRKLAAIHSDQGYPVYPFSSTYELTASLSNTKHLRNQSYNPHQRVSDLQYSISQLRGPISVIVDYLSFSHSSAVRKYASLRQNQLIRSNDPKVIQKCADEISSLLDDILSVGTSKPDRNQNVPSRASSNLASWVGKRGSSEFLKSHKKNVNQLLAPKTEAGFTHTAAVNDRFLPKTLNAGHILKEGGAINLLKEYRKAMKSDQKQPNSEFSLKTPPLIPSSTTTSSQIDILLGSIENTGEAGLNSNTHSQNSTESNNDRKDINTNRYNYQYGMPIPPYSSLYNLNEKGDYVPIIKELPNKQDILNLNTPETFIVGQEIPPLSDLHDLLEDKVQLAIELAAAKQEVWNYNVRSHKTFSDNKSGGNPGNHPHVQKSQNGNLKTLRPDDQRSMSGMFCDSNEFSKSQELAGDGFRHGMATGLDNPKHDFNGQDGNASIDTDQHYIAQLGISQLEFSELVNVVRSKNKSDYISIQNVSSTIATISNTVSSGTIPLKDECNNPDGDSNDHGKAPIKTAVYIFLYVCKTACQFNMVLNPLPNNKTSTKDLNNKNFDQAMAKQCFQDVCQTLVSVKSEYLSKRSPKEMEINKNGDEGSDLHVKSNDGNRTRNLYSGQLKVVGGLVVDNFTFPAPKPLALKYIIEQAIKRIDTNHSADNNEEKPDDTTQSDLIYLKGVLQKIKRFENFAIHQGTNQTNETGGAQGSEMEYILEKNQLVKIFDSLPNFCTMNPLLVLDLDTDSVEYVIDSRDIRVLQAQVLKELMTKDLERLEEKSCNYTKNDDTENHQPNDITNTIEKVSMCQSGNKYLSQLISLPSLPAFMEFSGFQVSKQECLVGDSSYAENGCPQYIITKPFSGSSKQGNEGETGNENLLHHESGPQTSSTMSEHEFNGFVKTIKTWTSNFKNNWKIVNILESSQDDRFKDLCLDYKVAEKKEWVIDPVLSQHSDTPRPISQEPITNLLESFNSSAGLGLDILCALCVTNNIFQHCFVPPGQRNDDESTNTNGNNTDGHDAIDQKDSHLIVIVPKVSQ